MLAGCGGFRISKDAVGLCLYLVQLLLDGGGDGCAAAYDKLRYHLESIRSMQHISIGSVL